MTPPHPVTQDQWLDQVTRRRTIARRLWYGYVRYPRRWAKQFIRFLLTTPGKMTTMVVLLSVIITSAGWSMSTMAAERRASFDTLINNTEPVNYVAQSLYANLSAADTAASSSFVLVGDASSQSRSDYARSYQRAGKAIAQAATGFNTGDPELALLENLSQKLPVYTGLVETAWANNQQGNPVGVAYMSEASTLMREDLLPAASQLNVLTGQNVDKQQKALTEPLWVPLTGLVVALIALLVGQIWLAGITNRRLNRGMLCASVLMVVATLWGGTANAITWRTGSLGYERAAGDGAAGPHAGNAGLGVAAIIRGFHEHVRGRRPQRGKNLGRVFRAHRRRRPNRAGPVGGCAQPHYCRPRRRRLRARPTPGPANQ